MTRNSWRRGTALLGLLGLAMVPVSAEVSVDITGDGFQIIILGVTEGPDPWGMIWEPYRDIEGSRILNPNGSVRGDGRPDVTNPESGTSVVVWSFATAGDKDVALSEWTGAEWTETEFLTDAVTDELDPRALVTANGNLHVTWWVMQTKRLFLATRLANSNLWGLPREIEALMGGARPSLAEFEGKLHIAYERFSVTPTVEKDIVVARRMGAHQFEYITVGESQRTLANDPVMQVHGDIAWVEWKHSDDTFGYAVYREGAWGEMQTVPWPDPSWVGEEDARRAVRTIVLGSLESDAGSSTLQSGERTPDKRPARRFELPYRQQRPLR